MMKLAEIDHNLSIDDSIEKSDLVFYNIEQEPFRIYGVFRDGDRFRRIPLSIAERVNPGVAWLCNCTSGGRVRFITNSSYIAIAAELNTLVEVSQMPLSGICGLDMYVSEDTGERFVGTFIPPYGVKTGFQSILEFPNQQERCITINFPIYSGLTSLHVGIQQDASLSRAPDYRCEHPIVYYGPSITQGGCASRPGATYQNFLLRKLQWNYINLGFSGQAKGEDSIADWISDLDMAAFVLDYDYNAPSVDHLAATHERFFRKIRLAHPDIPIVIISRPKYHLTEEELQRLEVIRTTYRNAIANGDEHVYLVEGSALLGDLHEEATVDNCHPTDLGFQQIAQVLTPLMERIMPD